MSASSAKTASAAATALVPDWVVPIVPEGKVLTAHAVVIAEDQIVAVVPVDALAERFPDAHIERLVGKVLMPGLVNAHAHSAMALLRGLADDLPLMRWLQNHIWPSEQQWVGPEFVRDGSELAIAEMLLGGTTCFNDNYFFPDVTAEVAARVGMRAVVGLPIISVPTAWASTEDEYFDRGLAVRDACEAHPLVSVAFAPHAPYTVTNTSFERMRDLGESLDLRIHLHLLETADEVAMSEREHGCKPLERLSRLGLLNDRLLAVHMTQLSDADIEQVAASGCHVLHCPASNMKLASGFCRVDDLDQAGVNIAVGTDGAASNNSLSMWQELWLAALVAKGHSGNPEAVPAARILAMGTINGARALGLDEQIGSVEVGKQADLIAIDLQCLQAQPVHSVISQLAYATGRQQVSEVWVAGQRVVRAGQLTTLDHDRVCAHGPRWAERLVGNVHHP
jgi:5-methylthioadenosine/S-adenosylhomocysteine deaminase